MDDRKMHNNAPNMKYYIEPEKPFYKKIPVVPAIISRSNWEQVQIMMDNKKRTRSATNTIY
mgnify:FL=1